jgi:hypothetical protein
MDQKFADRMSDLADLTDEVLEQRWATLTQVANTADQHRQARFVLIACGSGLDRDADEWFWKPFREHERTLPVADGAELFTRFAECAARYLIEEERWLIPALLVRLAWNAGMQPFHQDLVDASVELLKEERLLLPEFSLPGAWVPSVSKAIEENPADPTTIGQQLTLASTAAQKAVTLLAKQVVAIGEWAQASHKRSRNEHGVVQWLLNGVREADRVRWSELPTDVVAVDAAVELAGFVEEAPQPRHEATLNQVLTVAKKTGPVSGVIDGLTHPPAAPSDEVLFDLMPLTRAIASGTPLNEIQSTDLAVRILWEVITARVWDAP